MINCIGAKVNNKLSMRALLAFQNYLKNDKLLQKSFKPTKELMMRCKLN